MGTHFAIFFYQVASPFAFLTVSGNNRDLDTPALIQEDEKPL